MSTIKELASKFQAEPLLQMAVLLEKEHESLSNLEIGQLIAEISLASERTIVALKRRALHPVGIRKISPSDLACRLLC